MRNLIVIISIVLSINLFAGEVVKKVEQPKIQMAILLDTSNSMDGLINQAKSQLWKIVNEFATSKKDGISPKLEVALFEYGKSTLSAESGYVKMIVPLTEDLDKISEELFALKTMGGDEYCGKVIKDAVDHLSWSKSDKDLKLIFIAGNEPFDQGNVSYKTSCKDAISKSIVVNTIHCGSYDEGVRTFWKDGADIADGKYVNIDSNYVQKYIEAPQDKEIAKLGQEINKTYIGYGESSKTAMARQEAQDSNAAGASSESMVQRSVFKSKAQYSNSSWDLVDAKKSGKDVSKMSDEELPEEMKKMDKKERVVYVEKKKIERETIQKKIDELGKEREKYLAKKRAEEDKKDKNSLDTAIIDVVHVLGAKKGYKFSK